ITSPPSTSTLFPYTTLFRFIDEHGAPDLARCDGFARHLLKHGCDGLNVLGTTGEATSFSVAERTRLMSHYRQAGLPMRRLMVGRSEEDTSELQSQSNLVCVH